MKKERIKKEKKRSRQEREGTRIINKWRQLRKEGKDCEITSEEVNEREK